MTREVLFLVRAGRQSLHQSWGTGGNRLFDVHVSYYGETDFPYSDSSDSHSFELGAKWVGIQQYLYKHPEVLDRYAYIGFFDDDLVGTTQTINRLAKALLKDRPLLAQPALTRNSYYSHEVTLARPFSVKRHVNFVEIMCPCIRTDFLKNIIETFAINSSGWGLEWLWAARARTDFPGESFLIYDHLMIEHTRPVGSAGSSGAIMSPKEEMAAVFQHHAMSFFKPNTLQQGWLSALVWRLCRQRLVMHWKNEDA